MRWPAYLRRIPIFLPRLRQCSAARHDGELLRGALLVGVGTAILAPDSTLMVSLSMALDGHSFHTLTRRLKEVPGGTHTHTGALIRTIRILLWPHIAHSTPAI